MNYEAPEMTTLRPALSAIQIPRSSKEVQDLEDADLEHNLVPSYQEWE
jgi:hypothetical protein